MDLAQYSAKMLLVPWDMMCDKKDRRKEIQEDKKDRRTERTGGKKYRRKEIQEERNTGGKKYRK